MISVIPLKDVKITFGGKELKGYKDFDFKIPSPYVMSIPITLSKPICYEDFTLDIDFENLMPEENTLQESINKLIKLIRVKKDQLIKDAISHALGTTDWKPEDIKERGRFEIQQISLVRYEYFVFDGKKMILFLENTYEQDSKKLEATLNYKELWKQDGN